MSVNRSDFVPLQEVADAWSVTRRYVNMCIEQGRIPGAMKVGNMWLLPKDAQKPTKDPVEPSVECDDCRWFHREETPYDVIGVCVCEARRREQKEEERNVF